MKSVFGIFLGTLFLFLGSFLIKESGAQEELQCRGRDLQLNKTQVQDTLQCLSNAGTNSIWKIAAYEMPCFGMCILTARGFVSSDGEHIVLSRIVKYIAIIVKPESVAKSLTEMVTKCVNEHGDKVSAKNDPTCMTFLEVGQCIRDSFMEICVADDDD